MTTPTARPSLNGFKERLLAELVPMVVDRAQPPAPAVSAKWRNKRRIAVAAVAAAGLCAAIPTVIDSVTGEPAYAMVRHADGSITVTFKDLDHLQGLQDRLSRYGVRSLVLVRTIPKTGVIPCENRSIVSAPGFVDQSDDSDLNTVAVIHPDKQPPGSTLVFNVIRVSGGGPMMGIDVQKPPQTALCDVVQGG